jgi:hypothetical protein
VTLSAVKKRIFVFYVLRVCIYIHTYKQTNIYHTSTCIPSLSAMTQIPTSEIRGHADTSILLSDGHLKYVCISVCICMYVHCSGRTRIQHTYPNKNISECVCIHINTYMKRTLLTPMHMFEPSRKAIIYSLRYTCLNSQAYPYKAIICFTYPDAHAWTPMSVT